MTIGDPLPSKERPRVYRKKPGVWAVSASWRWLRCQTFPTWAEAHTYARQQAGYLRVPVRYPLPPSDRTWPYRPTNPYAPQPGNPYPWTVWTSTTKVPDGCTIQTL